MTDPINDGAPAGAQAVPPPGMAREPFPAVRLLYAIGFVVVAINGRVNDELKGFSLNLAQYLWELLAYITFARDEQPFPIGPFPRHP
jgi:hypothetical protein